jgi:hypothetical protein
MKLVEETGFNKFQVDTAPLELIYQWLTYVYAYQRKQILAANPAQTTIA